MGGQVLLSMVVASVLGGAAVATGLVVGVRVRRRWLVVTVRGHSMVPTYQPGDRLLARRCGLAEVRMGDVVVFLWPYAPQTADPQTGDRLRASEWVVKRVAALPGDPVPAAVAPAVPAGTGIVPPGALVVLGDNGGQDSTDFGLLDAARLLAVVVRRLG